MASGKMTGEWVPDELEGVMYDSEVEQAIHEVYINTLINNNIHIIQVYPSSDPLDVIEFDPVDYINKLFPTEQVCDMYLVQLSHILSLSL